MVDGASRLPLGLGPGLFPTTAQLAATSPAPGTALTPGSYRSIDKRRKPHGLDRSSVTIIYCLDGSRQPPKLLLEVSLTIFTAGTLSLVGGALALDFVNTSAGRDKGEPTDHIRRAVDLVDWAAHAGSVDAETARRSYAVIAADPDAAQKLLHHALQLRDAIYAIASAIGRGEAPPRTSLRLLKDCASKTMAAADLAPASSGGYAFDFSAAPADVALLGPVAWSAIAVLASGNFERLKQCPGPDCGWLFFDNSKNNSRRWCDMATCGNRTKGRRHRERR
jgi:predicted RNA-binding Zn ribbon-like protein